MSEAAPAADDAAALARGSASTDDQRALVAIDLGAESCRVSLLRWSAGRPVIELVHRFRNDAEQRADGLRWNIEAILRGLEEGLRCCASIATEGIRAIGVDGWAVDYVWLREDGSIADDPFCYRDERTIVSEAALEERIPAAHMRALTGVQLLRINTVYQLFADRMQGRITKQHRRWVNLPEYVLYRLGGRVVAERTNASHTQLLGTDGQWSLEIFDALGLMLEMAPPVVPAGTVVGTLQGPLAQLPAFAQTKLIAPACHDTASAIAAIPDAGEDWAYISSGTWSLVGTVLAAPVNTVEAQRENFTNLAGVGGSVCFHKNVNGMWLLRQCMDEWRELGATLELPALIAAAEQVSRPAHLLHVDAPELLLPGQMLGRINQQLQLRGLPAMSTAVEDAPQMASLLFHSLAARYAEVLRSVQSITGKQLRTLYIMGGGSQNAMLNRLTAEATGLEVRRAGTECSTVGNFAVQLAALEREPGTGQRARVTGWATRLQCAV
jgi:rhamnulokinase